MVNINIIYCDKPFTKDNLSPVLRELFIRTLLNLDLADKETIYKNEYIVEKLNEVYSVLYKIKDCDKFKTDDSRLYKTVEKLKDLMFHFLDKSVLNLRANITGPYLLDCFKITEVFTNDNDCRIYFKNLHEKTSTYADIFANYSYPELDIIYDDNSQVVAAFTILSEFLEVIISYIKSGNR